MDFKLKDIKLVADAIAKYPELNSTELAQKLAGGYKREKYDYYVKTLHIINKLKRRRDWLEKQLGKER